MLGVLRNDSLAKYGQPPRLFYRVVGNGLYDSHSVAKADSWVPDLTLENDQIITLRFDRFRVIVGSAESYFLSGSLTQPQSLQTKVHTRTLPSRPYKCTKP